MNQKKMVRIWAYEETARIIKSKSALEGVPMCQYIDKVVSKEMNDYEKMLRFGRIV